MVFSINKNNLFVMTLLEKLKLPFLSFVITIFLVSINCFSAQIKIKWTPNKEKRVAGYKIYYGNSSRNYTDSIDVGNKTSYTISNLLDGKTYFIGITAYNLNGKESSYSNEISYVASNPAKNLNPVPINKQNTPEIKRTNSSFVYATKYSRIVHLPNCKELISSIESEAKKSEPAQTSVLEIDFNYQIAQLEKQILELSKKYLDAHPAIVQRKKQIIRLKKQMKEESIKKIAKEKINDNPVSRNLLDNENVVKFLSIEEAIQNGCIACSACNP